jgi:hypothetical protein
MLKMDLIVVEICASPQITRNMTSLIENSVVTLYENVNLNARKAFIDSYHRLQGRRYLDVNLMNGMITNASPNHSTMRGGIGLMFLSKSHSYETVLNHSFDLTVNAASRYRINRMQKIKNSYGNHFLGVKTKK